MYFPIRCFTCNAPIAHVYEKYCVDTARGRKAGELLDEMGMNRICCRRMFVTAVPDLHSYMTTIIDDVSAPYLHMKTQQDRSYIHELP
jgi:DNA-directed RNA polymerase subunit N (RpoN/RPB10)